ncbi:cysteine desulfurase family protein [Flavobacterium psychrophilum]|uniref:cysteine desulfurase family protein n=1 Tax=Flavobacterium psychrophilum TaxID=96345 RepID=UPI000904085A|nr:cysteine desulfurase family protein [Flavobacterium psychrophilum]EKT4501017.1 cysteine desulfurase [Flavobacterium psychrophilum]ELM3643112.1 cysteine desulfurase [Flavobacterium psychrophilum]ELY1979747.1 cysteine desulfurase [Flavobacterium psychrophilum]MBF2023975.1 cysteine desulfurase [Flavobacterium psychrophilum]MCB5983913.1 cysteine desulfurase [Flavobacterium psychrophilum]
MKKVYLDNAATTQLRPEVIAEMTQVLMNDYGNPSSTHALGRHSKNLVELSRKIIAKNINCTAQEIIFTSCGTEANNFIIQSCFRDLKIERIITSKIEHHAVLHTVQILQKSYNIRIDYVNILPSGEIDLVHLSDLLSIEGKTLVSLMHVNNEIGTILNLNRVAKICKQYQAYFHTDTVQSIGKTAFNLQETPIDFLVASAHKFHGPKGVGFAFIRKGILLNPILLGGEQEKGMRAGTECVHNIVGMAKALELCYLHLDEEEKYILKLKEYTISQLKSHFPEIKFNGNPEETFYNILNIILPFSEEKTSMILFNLDMKGIAVSRGSACQSGSVKPSHVLAEILSKEDLKKPSLRISFSHYNTLEDIDYLIENLKTV